MKDYTVYYLVKEILSVKVNADCEEEAKIKAEKILNNEKRKDSSCVDEKITFAGLNNNDVWREINS